jgi:hypothetical protein
VLCHSPLSFHNAQNYVYQSVRAIKRSKNELQVLIDWGSCSSWELLAIQTDEFKQDLCKRQKVKNVNQLKLGQLRQKKKTKKTTKTSGGPPLSESQIIENLRLHVFRLYRMHCVLTAFSNAIQDNTHLIAKDMDQARKDIGGTYQRAGNWSISTLRKALGNKQSKFCIADPTPKYNNGFGSLYKRALANCLQKNHTILLVEIILRNKDASHMVALYCDHMVILDSMYQKPIDLNLWKTFKNVWKDQKGVWEVRQYDGNIK